MPLPPPAWFSDDMMIFKGAVQKASKGHRVEAIAILKTLRSEEMAEWFCVHGQMSGLHRSKRLNIPRKIVPKEMRDPLRNPLKYSKAVYERDSYTCRYCGLRLIPKEVLYAFEKIVGCENFRVIGTNAQQHGIIHGFRIVADHVVDHSSGGRTDLENLVSACPACNYGKFNYSLEQLGIENPRLRPPVDNGWDGLVSLLPGMKEREFNGN